MASATSESYCNHLHGQLKEWERAFRSRNGRLPKQPDFEALENDGSARGRLVHGAYMALNRATGDSFIKSLSTRESTRGMTIIGGPRQRAAERKNADTLRNAERFRRGVGNSCNSNSSNNNNDHSSGGGKRLGQGGVAGVGARGQRVSGRGSLRQTKEPISQHLAIMERLRAKVQPRSGSSLAAHPASSGKAGGVGAGQKVNAVLAAGDGHRRSSSSSGATAGKKRLEGDPSGGGGGVSVSRRARAMGMSATAVKNPAAAAATATAKPDTSTPSSVGGRRKSVEDVERPSGSSRARQGGWAEGSGFGGDGSGGRVLDQESRGGAGARAESGERLHGAHRREHAVASLQPSAGTGNATIEENNASAKEIGGGSVPSRGEGTLPRAADEAAGGCEGRMKSSSGGTTPYVDTHNSKSQPAEREERQHQHEPPSISSEHELTPERRATRRVGDETRNRRSAVTDTIGIRSLSFRSESGRGSRKGTRSLPGERSFSGAAAAFSSAGAKAVSKGSSTSGRYGEGSGSGDASTAVATDEAGLAVAIMKILQSPESDGSHVSPAATAAWGGGAGEGKQQATRRGAAATTSSLLLATNIVNTAGGGGGSGSGGEATASQNISSLSSFSSFSSSTLVTPRADSKKGRAAAATTMAGNTTAPTGAICAPGLVAASSGARRTAGDDSGMEGDWQLRASRAVGRVRGEEEAVQAAAMGTRVAEGTEAVAAPGTDDTASENTPSRSKSASYGSASRDAIVPDIRPPRRGSETAPPTQRTERISDSDGDGGDDSDWNSGGGSGRSGGKQTEGDRERRAAAAAAAASRATAAPGPAARPRPAAAKKRKQQPASKNTSEVSDNFVRADLKSRGSSRFKRKGSGRSKARGGSGGRSFGGRNGGGRWGGRGGRGFGGGRFGGGGSKWGGGSKGAEDPVTGEKGGAPRDRPLSSGAAKNRAGLDVLDQCLDALAVATGDCKGGVAGGGGCDEQGNTKPFQRPRNAKEEEELFLRLAPRCPQHQRPGKLLTVRKTGLNKGRKFYACNLPRGEGCDFFMWAEDNPALVLSELTLQETRDEWRQRKTALLSKSLTKLPIPELKKELKKRQLSCGGKKGDLIERLVDHAAAELGSSATSCVLVPSSSERDKEKENWSAGRARGESEYAPGEGRSKRKGAGSSSGGSHGDALVDGSDDSDDDDSDDDEGSEFEFAFAESVKPAAFSTAAMASAVAVAALPEQARNTADGSNDPLSSSIVPATTTESDNISGAPPVTADEAGRDGGGAGDGYEDRTRGRNGNDSSAAIAADAPLSSSSSSSSSSSKGDDTGEGGGEVGGSAAAAAAGGRKRPLAVLGEAGEGEADAGDEDEDKEEEEDVDGEGERGGNREPAWASLVRSDDDEDDQEEDDEIDEDDEGGGEEGEGGGRISGDDFVEGRGDSDDDSVWSEEEERRDRASKRRRAERNKRRKLADGGASGRHSRNGATAGAATASSRKGGSSGSSSSDDLDSDSDSDSDDAVDEGRKGRKQGGKTADSDGGEGGDDPDLPLTPATALRRVFGHRSFRDGQEWGVDRAMKGLPSLLVLATGTGKSLTYQLPALLLPGITVVVSPLVSLMEDQMANLPPQLPGASLSGSHGGLREVAVTVRDLKAGRVKVLFLSPEKLCSPSFRRLASTPGALPPVSLLCVDEAHCVSQWSHNFRPSYLRLGQTLDLLRPRGVLALTATASKAVIKDICATLRIPVEGGVRVGSWDRPNLDVRVLRSSSDDDKRSRLSRLLQEAPLDRGSIVVYVWRQVTAEAVCALLQGDGHNAVAYHGGMEAGARQKAQAAFMRGRARVVVATVAFGLGVDMRDIRGVVHFDMPKSIENYVQEIGRAGRDGRSARCCLLLCDKDFITHHSLSHSKGLELVQVRGLLRSIISGAPQGMLAKDPNKETAPGSGGQYDDAGVADGASDGDAAAGLQKALSVVDLESRLDVGGEVVETVLSVLEGEPYRLLKLHAVMDDRLVVHFRKRRPSVLASGGEPVIGLLLALGTVEGLASSGKGYSYGHGSARVSLVRLSEALGWAPAAVVRELRRLQFMGEVEYSLSQRSFHVTLLRGLSATELEEVCQRLHRTLSRAEALEAEKVEGVYLALAAEAAGGGEGQDGTSSLLLPPKISGKKRAWVGDAGAVVAASDEDGAGNDGGETSDCNRNNSSSIGGPAPTKARSLLHATISRYFDEGSNTHRNKSHGGGSDPPGTDGDSTGLASAGGDGVSRSGGATGDVDLSSMAIEGEQEATTNTVSAVEKGGDEGTASKRDDALPHQPLDKRACEVLVRDASVLVTHPSFQGRLDAGFDDGFGSGVSGGGGGGGLGFFDVATGTTASAGGGGGAGVRGMAPHSWLLKDVPMLARAAARVFHGIGSVSFPAAKWRDSAFWARYRQHSFREVKNKLEIAFGARRL